MRHTQYAVFDRNGEQVSLFRYSGERGYDDAEEVVETLRITHPSARVDEVPKRLPRRRS